MTKEKEPTIFERLAAIFPHECVEWRAGHFNKEGTQALALCYIDARSVMARLDEVVGPANWQNRYIYQGNRTFCEIGLRINDEWVWKGDVAGDTDIEAVKGGASGAMKRAAVMWGIGRYLYDVDAIWADCKSYKGRNDKWAFKEWTPAGAKMLEGALAKAPGARFTEKPESVQMMLELISKAKTTDELEDIRKKHWAGISLEYRAEVLRAGTAKKRELENAPPPPKSPVAPRRQSRPPQRNRIQQPKQSVGG